MKKNQKKKNKSKSLILLLFITIIMFGTSTYAWFTANKVVTINEIDVQVQATGGIQISTNAVDWKSVITNSDITGFAYSGNSNQMPATVTAVSTAGVVDTTAGRLKMYKATIDNAVNSSGASYYTIVTEQSVEATQNSTSGDFVAFDVFLRVDADQTIYLTSDSDVINKSNEDKGLKNSARVAFLNLGHANSDATSDALIALKTPGAVTLWEPNADAHTTVVTNSVAKDYGVTVQSDRETAYYGVNNAFSTALPLKDVVNGTNTAYTTAMTPNIITKQGNSVYSQLFTLTKGITKMRIYMWIEGQDIDCENNATGSEIGFKVSLSTQSSAAGESGGAGESSSSSSDEQNG